MLGVFGLLGAFAVPAYATIKSERSLLLYRVYIADHGMVANSWTVVNDGFGAKACGGHLYGEEDAALDFSLQQGRECYLD